jgi:uncharacterized alkaline shock family protein YloU
MDLVLYYGYKIAAVFKEIRNAIAKEIETVTSLNVSGVSLTVKSLSLKSDYKNKNEDFITT